VGKSDDRKPRFRSQLVRPEDIRWPASFGIDGDGTPWYGPEISRVIEATYYNRDNGKPKIINQIEYSGRAPSSINRRLKDVSISRMAIDTNTIDGISVSAPIAFWPPGASPDPVDPRSWDYTCPFAIVMRGCIHNPEKIGWLVSYNIFVQAGIIDAKAKTLAVVDHDLGSIPAYNKRSIPVLGNEFLPQQMELIYASDATGAAESISNKMISKCDRFNRTCRKVFVDSGRYKKASSNRNTYCEELYIFATELSDLA